MDTKGILMHIDRTNEITVASETAGAAHPISSLGLVSMSTYRTPARCSSFGAGEAHDAGYFGLVGEIVDVASVFPQGYMLVVMTSLVLPPHAVRVPMKSVPTSFSTQKSITCLVAL